MFQQYFKKASVDCYLYHFDGTMVLNKIVDSRLHDGQDPFTFPPVSWWETLSIIMVIQHVHGIEHITDKLQTKSLEFTYEFTIA
jgi:hypothetical protein